MTTAWRCKLCHGLITGSNEYWNKVDHIRLEHGILPAYARGCPSVYFEDGEERIT